MSWGFVQKNKAVGSGNVPSLAVALSGVAVGDLLCLGWSAYATGSPTWSVSDGANAWTVGPVLTGGANTWAGTAYCIVNTGGSLTIALTPSASAYLAVGVTEFSVASGMTISPVTTAKNSGSSTGASSGNLTFSGSGNFLVWGASAATNVNNAAGSGFTLGNQTNYNAATNEAYLDEYQLNLPASSSPLAVTATNSGASTWDTCGLVFLEMSPSPGSALRGSIVRDRSHSRRLLLAD